MNQAKIEIKDEVNVKIHGLELSDRRALMKMFEYTKPGAQYLPAVRLGRWNGKISYFSLAGSTYLNLLDQIIPYLYDKGYDITLQDNRQASKELVFEQIKEDSFSDTVWPKGHPLEGKPIILRDYQVSAVNSFLANPQSLQEIATGAGKSVMTAALSKSVQHLGRSIVIVPNKSLVTQTEDDYINLGLDVGVYFGDRKEYGKTHTICTWQSLDGLIKGYKDGTVDEEKKNSFFEDIICVIVDEVHGAKASALQNLLTGIFSNVPIRWGLTGTIPKEKMDQVSLLVSLGPVIGQLSASELQDKGVLANCHVNIIQMKDSKEFTNYQSELKFLLENEDRLDAIANLINKVNETGNTLVLVDRVNAGKELAARLPGSVVINGAVKVVDRKEEYDQVATSDDKILIATYGVAAVGINIVRLHNVVLIEPGKSFVRVIQSIGRGLRKGHDKQKVNIYDICSDCKFSKRHLTHRKNYYKEAKYEYTVEKVDY
jgi:superfamily II DNA or RNA helicase